MSERDQLLAILRRVRRRLRGLAALQGAVVGLGAALLAGAAWIAVARWRGPVGRPVAVSALLVVIGAGFLGAGLAILRRVPLQRCARALDRVWAGSDRMLSALAFLEQTPTAFTRAAIKDAVDRAQVVAPAHVAPLRRPRGVAALGLGAAVAVVAALAPLPQHGGRAAAKGKGMTGATPVSAKATAAAPLRASDLEAERQEVRAAEEAAKALGDPTLEEAAAALARTIAALTAAGAGRGEALERLAALQERAEQAARDAEALAAGLRRAGEAMESTKETRALADGLTAGNPAATAESAGELAASAERSTAAGRESLARALERAAEQAGREASGGSGSSGSKGGDQKRAAGAGGGEEDSQRRLQRESSAQDQAGGEDSGADNGPSERRLQRLERDLRDTANACRENPAVCQQQLRERARSLPKMQQESRGAEARRNLARAVQQLRERLQREGQSDHGGPSDKQRQRQEQRRFARAASGQRGTAGGNRSAGNGGGDQGEQNGEGDESGDGDGDEMADGSSGGNGRSGTPSGSAGGDSTGAGVRGDKGDGHGEGSSEQAIEGGNGGGIGNEGGGQALGHQKDLRAARGREREAAVRSTAGPKRSSVIQSAAARGFAHGDYRRVYQDYDAVMEESLDATAVPPGQRYLVRRYFQLIRPRSAMQPTTTTTTTTATPRTTTQPGGPPP